MDKLVEKPEAVRKLPEYALMKVKIQGETENPGLVRVVLLEQSFIAFEFWEGCVPTAIVQESALLPIPQTEQAVAESEIPVGD